MDLAILTVTRGGWDADPFLRDLESAARCLGARLVVAHDGDWKLPTPVRLAEHRDEATIISVKSKGYIESVLDEAVEACPEGYILRLDDDERIGAGMFKWLVAGGYRSADHWKFPRAHLWGSEGHFLFTPPLWPDWQTRLSIKAKSGHRRTVHAGSPYGGGEECPHYIEHHKFLVKDRAERERIAGVYDRFTPGYGTGAGMLPFSLPELAFPDLGSRLRNLEEAAA